MWIAERHSDRSLRPPVGAPDAWGKPQQQPGRRRSFILVEDSPADSRLFELRMRTCDPDVKVSVVRDGAAATELLNGVIEGTVRRPDLLVLDLNLPILKGWEVLRHIKESPLLRFLPVVVLSSSRVPQEVDRAYAEGAASYIHKGRNLDDFQAAVDAIHEYWCGIVDLP